MTNAYAEGKMQTFIFILELIGTIAFAISGAMTALKKNMDIFGVAILGLTTAVGGGAIRDILLGITPPVMFREPVYALLAIFVSVVVFIPSVRRLLTRRQSLYEHMMLVMDSIGLGVFTVVGINTAYGVSDDFNLFLLIFVGTVTGVGGGVLRDVLAGNTPYIFVKHIYACASIVGAILCAALRAPLGEAASVIIGASAVIIIRLLAAHYKWSLPHSIEK